MTERILRWTAIAIAAAALIDPSVQLSGRVRPRVAVVSMTGAASKAVRDRFVESVRGDFEVVDGAVDGAAAMVFIGDHYPDIAVPSSVPVSAVTLGSPGQRNVRVAAIRAPRRVPPHTAVPLEIDVDAASAAGSTSLLTVSSGAVEVGRISHTWRSNPERWHATLDVVPVGDSPFVIRAHVDPIPGRSAGARNDDPAVLVDAVPNPLRVVAYEPRPSWAATFVRRALENDPRFAVASVTGISRGIDVRAGDARSLADALAADIADVVVVGGLDQVSSADVRLLDRFMRERGGSVVLLPDSRVDAGPVRELIRGSLSSETFTDAHAPLTMIAALPRIDASEILAFKETPPEAQVLARAGGSNAPVVAIFPRGDGRLMFSGALDAWRSRAEKDVAFDRFWQAAIAGLALETPPLVDVTVVPALPAAGDRVRVSVRVRGDASAVSATVDEREVLRLWPTAAAGRFTATFAAPPGRAVHVVKVVADEAKLVVGRGRFVVGADAASIAPSAPLAMLAASHGGINVDADHVAVLAAHLRATIVPERARQRSHPMRSPWWLVPFAACLSGEWWVRRRQGRR